MIEMIAAEIVAASQSLIALVEMGFWMRPAVHTRLFFGEEDARKVAPIVRNAGLYNAFLAAGLVWGFAAGPDRAWIFSFFLVCVAIAGIFGAFTLKSRSPFPLTLLIQTRPAAIGLAAIWWPSGR